MKKVLLCQVAVSAAAYQFDKPYLYRVPEDCASLACAGMRCVVPFGAGNRRREGLLLRVFRGEPQPNLKEVLQLLDEAPVLDAEGIQLALWMRERYFCTVHDAMRAMLPSGLYFSLRDSVALAPGVTPEQALAHTARAPAQRLLVERLLRAGGAALREELYDAPELRHPAASLRLLLEAGIVTLDTSASRAVGDRTEQVAELTCPPEEALERLSPRAKARRAVVNFLAQAGSASTKDISYFTGAGKSVVQDLAKQELVTLFTREVFRSPSYTASEHEPPPVLNQEQEAAFQGISALLDGGKPACALLYGVTGSGKTQVYLKLIHRVLSEGKTALMLVPEIALTPQMVRRFQAQFGARVAVLHSALSAGARMDEWKRIRQGKARVVVGTRSAVFAPLENLGLVILDEEQESSYQSEQNPRYHARAIAKYRCKQRGAVLVLGSATPTVETMYQAELGRYHLFRLRERYNAQNLPRVYLADMRRELREHNGTNLSRELQRQIKGALERGEQTILFLNRRGTSRQVVCTACGYTPECPNCTVKLTWHSDNHRLMCHYCGYSEPVPSACPVCGELMAQVGTGIQKVEEELKVLFPGREILRMDADTVSAANTHEKILSRFEQEKIPFLLGTQMVTKGLDFENVTVVGVIDADLSFYSESYRAPERTFSLLTQVAGRAGRGQKQGCAVIQTLTPKNEVIRCAARQDYDSFYASELAQRRLRCLPPFRDFYRLTVSGARQGDAVRAAATLKDGIRIWLETPELCAQPWELLGPASAPVLKVMGRYRYRITLLCTDSPAVRRMLSAVLTAFLSGRREPSLSLAIDLNPMD